MFSELIQIQAVQTADIGDYVWILLAAAGYIYNTIQKNKKKQEEPVVNPEDNEYHRTEPTNAEPRDFRSSEESFFDLFEDEPVVTPDPQFAGVSDFDQYEAPTPAPEPVMETPKPEPVKHDVKKKIRSTSQEKAKQTRINLRNAIVYSEIINRKY